jgi:hypothetical protein
MLSLCNIAQLFLLCRRKQYTPPKRLLTISELHSVKSQKMRFAICRYAHFKLPERRDSILLTLTDWAELNIGKKKIT